MNVDANRQVVECIVRAIMAQAWNNTTASSVEARVGQATSQLNESLEELGRSSMTSSLESAELLRRKLTLLQRCVRKVALRNKEYDATSGVDEVMGEIFRNEPALPHSACVAA